MAGYTSFDIGGPAEVLVMPKNAIELTAVWNTCHLQGFPITILGGGNNVLVADNGIRGVVVVTKHMDEITVDGNKITAGCGTKLAKLAETACKAGLSGLEFAHGIPGTVGGAIVMNAGAYDGEIKDVCTSVIAVSPKLDVAIFSHEELALGYRTSRFQTEPAVIVEACFELTPKDQKEIRARMDELKTKRREKQPIDKRSAGSTFKRPKQEGIYAAKLIDDCGLKGFTIGGAQVSEKHSGFVINTGNATSQDVLDIMKAIMEKVHAASGIWLEPEVQFLGF